MSPDVLLECPRTSFRDVLRVNVTERVWIFPHGGGGGADMSPPGLYIRSNRPVLIGLMTDLGYWWLHCLSSLLLIIKKSTKRKEITSPLGSVVPLTIFTVLASVILVQAILSAPKRDQMKKKSQLQLIISLYAALACLRIIFRRTMMAMK